MKTPTRRIPDRIGQPELARRLGFSVKTMYRKRLRWGLTVLRDGLGIVYYRCDEVAAAMDAIERGSDPKVAVASVKAMRN